MARLMLLRERPDLEVDSAGTFVLEGQPMSVRTRRALERHDLVDLSHRSRQFGADHAEADLIVAMEPQHVEWMGHHFPGALPRIGLLPALVREWPVDALTLPDALDRLRLAEATPDPGDTVVDPAGGEQPDFDRCADELAVLITRLAALLPGP